MRGVKYIVLDGLGRITVDAMRTRLAGNGGRDDGGSHDGCSIRAVVYFVQLYEFMAYGLTQFRYL
jgi:hypothetical protein